MGVRKAKYGDRVLFSYRGLLSDGTEVCASRENEAIELSLGQRQVFPLIEDALIGLSEGSEREVELTAADAYGDYSEELVFEIPLSEVPEGIAVKRGTPLSLSNREGREYDGVITHVGRRSIRVDANHPLAGEALRYQVRVHKIS